MPTEKAIYRQRETRCALDKVKYRNTFTACPRNAFTQQKKEPSSGPTHKELPFLEGRKGKGSKVATGEGILQLPVDFSL